MVQVTLAMQATVGELAMVTEPTGSVSAPLTNCVDVAVTRQPTPVPRASLISSACVLEVVWFEPLSVTLGT